MSVGENHASRARPHEPSWPRRSLRPHLRLHQGKIPPMASFGQVLMKAPSRRRLSSFLDYASRFMDAGQSNSACGKNDGQSSRDRQTIVKGPGKKPPKAINMLFEGKKHRQNSSSNSKQPCNYPSGPSVIPNEVRKSLLSLRNSVLSVTFA